MLKDAGGENRGHGGRLKDGAGGMEGERWSRRGPMGTLVCKRPHTPTEGGQGGCNNWDDQIEMVV